MAALSFLSSQVTRRLCDSRGAVAELAKWVQLADAMGQPPSPRTCAEWAAMQRQILSVVRDNPVRGMTLRRAWTYRCVVITVES
jgi:hypothetical protein